MQNYSREPQNSCVKGSHRGSIWVVSGCKKGAIRVLYGFKVEVFGILGLGFSAHIDQKAALLWNRVFGH